MAAMTTGNRIPTYIFYYLAALCLCIAAGYLLFTVKNNVNSLRVELASVKAQLRNEEDTIHILKAEVAYLTSPARLKLLSEKYLSLKEVKVDQLAQNPLDDFYRHNKSPKQAQKNVFASSRSIKWRYKKFPSKYVTKVSKRK